MSRVLVLFAHPSHTSYGFAVLEELHRRLVAHGHEVDIDDLYVSDFNPTMTTAELYEHTPPADIRREQERVLWSDVLAFIYPVWWWTPPAVLKGWLERVVSLGFAFHYDIAQNGFLGDLGSRKAIVITTASSHPDTYSVPWQAAAQLDFVSAILAVSGITDVVSRHYFNVSQYAAHDELCHHLTDIETVVATIGAPKTDKGVSRV